MTQVVVFGVEQERFGLPLPAVDEVVRAAWPLWLPRPPFGCIGAIDVRGQVLPLLDLGALLGLRRTPRKDAWAQKLAEAHFLLVDCGGARVALCVDRVFDVADVEAETQGAAGPRWRVLDPRSLVGNGRLRLLSGAAARAQEAGG